MSVAKISACAGKRARQMPSAATVPSPVARTVAETPMIKLFFSEDSQNAELKKSSYQRRLKPGSGYMKNDPEENDSGTMVRMGATRNTSTAPVSTLRPVPVMRSPSVSVPDLTAFLRLAIADDNEAATSERRDSATSHGEEQRRKPTKLAPRL